MSPEAEAEEFVIFQSNPNTFIVCTASYLEHSVLENILPFASWEMPFWSCTNNHHNYFCILLNRFNLKLFQYAKNVLKLFKLEINCTKRI